MTTPTDAYAALRLERLHTAPPDPEPRSPELSPDTRLKLRYVIAGINEALNEDRAAKVRNLDEHYPPITTKQISKARTLRAQGKTWVAIGRHLGIDAQRIGAAVNRADRNAA